MMRRRGRRTRGRSLIDSSICVVLLFGLIAPSEWTKTRPSESLFWLCFSLLFFWWINHLQHQKFVSFLISLLSRLLLCFLCFQLHELLGKSLMVTVRDGRVLDGVAVCFDNNANVILNETTTTARSQRVRLGQVLINSKEIVKIEVEVCYLSYFDTSFISFSTWCVFVLGWILFLSNCSVQHSSSISFSRAVIFCHFLLVHLLRFPLFCQHCKSSHACLSLHQFSWLIGGFSSASSPPFSLKQFPVIQLHTHRFIMNDNQLFQNRDWRT